MINNKLLRWILTAVFTIGAAAFIGILSFSGMLYLSNSIVAAVASALLAVIIEGEIYKQNIFISLKMLLRMGKFLEEDNYAKVLKKFVKHKDHDEVLLRDKSPLLKEYYEISMNIARLEHLGWWKTRAQHQDKRQAETQKAEIENFFMRYLKGQIDQSNPTETSREADLNLVIADQKNRKQQEIQQKTRREKAWLWASAPITLLGGGMAMFVTASQLSAAFISFGVVMTPVVMGAAVWPIAGLAAMGFMLMIYKTFVDIIHNEKIIKFWKKVKTKFIKASPLEKILYVAGMALVIGLALAATIATAGTWWTAAQAGLTLLPFLATAATAVRMALSTIGVGMMSIGMLLFDYGNSLESIKVAKDLPEKLWAKMKIDFNTWGDKDFGERINPFAWLNRIISWPFRVLVFIGHLISIGVTGDRLANLSPAITATVGAVQEGLTDIHYLVDDDEHHDHQHSDIAGFFLNIFLAPTKFLSAAWNAITNHFFSQKKKTFLEFLKEEFGFRHQHAPVPDQQIVKALIQHDDHGHHHHHDRQDDLDPPPLLNPVDDENFDDSHPTPPLLTYSIGQKLGESRHHWFAHKSLQDQSSIITLEQNTRMAAPCA